MIRTFAPFESIWSAIVWNAVLSPFAFWISTVTPAFLNAAVRNERSAVSQRFDEAASGRITPTKSAAFAGAATNPVKATAEAITAGFQICQ
jgi:hypothetical protein